MKAAELGVYYQLQTWNGVDWEVGHPGHFSMSYTEWTRIRKAVHGWSSKWRLVRVTTQLVTGGHK